jgi:hypothetical protein
MNESYPSCVTHLGQVGIQSPMLSPDGTLSSTDPASNYGTGVWSR